MQAIILDMYGVIVKDTGDGFYEFASEMQKHYKLALLSNDCSERS